MLGIVLRALHVLCHLISIIVGDRTYYILIIIY